MRTIAARFGAECWYPATRSKLFLLVVSVALSLAAHLVFLRALPAPWQENQSGDYHVFYEPVARQLAGGHGFYLPSGKPALKYPPGIPVVYGATFWLSDRVRMPHETGLRALQGLLTVATSVMVAMIAFENFGARAGLAACFLWSTYPFHLWLSKQPSAEPLVSVLLAASVLAFSRWLSNGRGVLVWGSVCGAVAAFAALAKPFNIGLAAVFAILPWVCDVKCTRRTRAAFSATVLIAFSLSILPWEIWASRTAGHIIPLCTNGTATLLDGITFGTGRNKVQKPPALPRPVELLAKDFAAHRKDLQSNSEVVTLLIAHTRRSPLPVALLFLTKAAVSWYGNDSHHHERWALLIQLFYLPLFTFGALVTRRGAREQRNFLFIATGITLYYWGMTTFVALPIVRYMVPAISLLMVLAGNAVGVIVAAFGWRPVLVKTEVAAP